jgi:hypothetical protein
MLHLPPAHRETRKHDSPSEIKIKVKQSKCSGCEFKHRQVSDSSQEVTIWFLNLPIDKSIDNKKHKVGSLNLRPHKAQLEDQKKLKVI